MALHVTNRVEGPRGNDVRHGESESQSECPRRFSLRSTSRRYKSHPSAEGEALLAIFVSEMASARDVAAVNPCPILLAARPGRIAAVEPVALGRPRVPAMEDAPEFHEHVRVLRSQLQDHHS